MSMEAYEIQAVIKNIQKQASFAKYISLALIYTLIFVISFLFYNAYKMTEKDTPAGLLGDYISDVFFSKNAPARRVAITEGPKNEDDTTKEMNLALKNAASAFEVMKSSLFTNEIAKAITSGILTVTVILMGLYTIKITIMFIRYYAQLSARYETQVTAFMAANGDIDKTIKLIQALSSNEIRMGTAPDSIYEKALDTVTKALAVKKD
jgi:hypothetical protein